jgi:hypothetical protein
MRNYAYFQTLHTSCFGNTQEQHGGNPLVGHVVSGLQG